MKRLFPTLFFPFIIFTSNGQVTKKNWMVGGSGRLESQKETLNSSEVKIFNVALSPSIGYFFIDKFAGGIRFRLAYSKIDFNGGPSKTTVFGIGPFFRYYFLNPYNRVNVFAESAYQYLRYSSNSGTSNNANVFTFSAGPVIYFNTSVGIEFTANYEISENNDAIIKTNTFFLNIGFQIHLEREKT